MKLPKIIGIGAVAALILSVGGATALAASSAGTIPAPGGVIEGCYANVGKPAGIHALTIRNSATPCPSGDTSLNWQQNGTAGPAGLNETIVTNAATGGATVMCPAAEPYAISGGGQVINHQTDALEAIADSTPDNVKGYPDGWTVEAVDPAAEAIAMADCTR